MQRELTIGAPRSRHEGIDVNVDVTCAERVRYVSGYRGLIEIMRAPVGPAAGVAAASNLTLVLRTAWRGAETIFRYASIAEALTAAAALGPRV